MQNIIPLRSVAMARTRKRSRQSSAESSKPSKRTKLNAVHPEEGSEEQPEKQPENFVLDDQQSPPLENVEPEQDAAPGPAQQSYVTTQYHFDHTHITQARQWIQRDALSRFQTLYDAATAIAVPEEGQQVIGYKDLLEDTQVQVAISVVTESIRWRLNRRDSNHDGAPRFFDVINYERILVARRFTDDGQNTILQTARPGRPLLFGWTYNKRDHEAVTGGEEDIKGLRQDMDEEDSEHRSHTFLIMVRMNDGLCEIRSYDSFPYLQFRRDPALWRDVLKEIKTVIRNIKWLPEELSDPVVEDVQADARFGPVVEVRVAEQSANWSCGLHTILNAWTIAMNLTPNPNFWADDNHREAFYDLATKMVNLVTSRVVNSNLLYAFLVGYGYALPSKPRDQCPSFPAPEEETFRNADGLATYVEDAYEIHEVGKRIGEHDLKARLLPESLPPPRKPRKAGPPQPRRLSVPRPHPEESRPGINPAVMANEIFATPDCMSFWRHLNSSRRMSSRFVQPDNFATTNGVHDFIWFICTLLDREKTINMSVEQRNAWFETEQRLFNRALYFAVEKEEPLTKRHFSFMFRQMSLFRRMAVGQFIKARERMQLVAAYAQFENNALPGIVNDYFVLWSRAALAPPPAVVFPTQQQTAAQRLSRKLQGRVFSSRSQRRHLNSNLQLNRLESSMMRSRWSPNT
jgi:hypothetical protein